MRGVATRLWRCLQAVRRAQGTLNANKGKLEADFAPDRKADGQAAIAKLDEALKDFQATVDANDKQVSFTDATRLHARDDTRIGELRRWKDVAKVDEALQDVRPPWM